MAKLTLSDITTGYSSVAAINANNEAIEAALENTLSRDGTSPNQMGATLDTNSNRIINLPAPISATEPLRLQDLLDFNDGGSIGSGADVYVVSFFDALSPTQIAAVQGGASTTNIATLLQGVLDVVGGQATNGAVFMPSGLYPIATALSIPNGVSLYGEGGSSSILSPLSCNGINFEDVSTDHNMCFYRDFGIRGRTGSTANWTAIESVLPSEALGVYGSHQRDGLHFQRISVRDFNTAWIVDATWDSTIVACETSKVNQAVRIGNYSIGWVLRDNTFTHESGDSFSGTADPIAVNIVASQGAEGITIADNDLYGFETCIKVDSVVLLDIHGNALESRFYGMHLATSAGGLNIKNNYVQLDGNNAVAAIYFPALGVEIPSVIAIEGNNLLIGSGSTTTSVGIKMNQFGWHNRIVGNRISGFGAYDIAVASASAKTLIENNRCESVVPTSIFLSTTSGEGPVWVDKNECGGRIYIEGSATDVHRGNVVLGENITHTKFAQLLWKSGVVYDTSVIVTVGHVQYLCLVQHTAGVFSTDLAAVKWQKVSWETAHLYGVGEYHSHPERFTFTIASGSASTGATYTNNGGTFTIAAGVSAATSVTATYNDAALPALVGTLTKASGSGDATITFSTFRSFDSLNYQFLVSAANATAGATYTNNGQTFTVSNTIVGNTVLSALGTADPAGAGTLTYATGTGDATLTFSAFTVTQALYRNVVRHTSGAWLDDISTHYRFVVTAAAATVGAVYTNNGASFTVEATIAGTTVLKMKQATGAPSSGNLVKSSGTGDATIAFSAATLGGGYWEPCNGIPDWHGRWDPGIATLTLGGSGTMIAVGSWHRHNNLCYVDARLTSDGIGATLASTGGTSYLSGLTGPIVKQVGAVHAINVTTKLSLGTGVLVNGGTDVHTPTWAATAANDTVAISGSFTCGAYSLV